MIVETKPEAACGVDTRNHRKSHNFSYRHGRRRAAQFTCCVKRRRGVVTSYYEVDEFSMFTLDIANRFN